MRTPALVHGAGLKSPTVRAGTRQGGRDGSLPRLPWPGFEPLRSCLDILVYDSSYSVSGPNGNDPVGNRYQESLHALERVSNYTESNRQRVSVLHFDHPVGSSGVVTLSAPLAMERLRGALRVPHGGVGTSDLGRVLLTAERQARSRRLRDVRLTVFSDFELTDSDVRSVYDRLAVFPGTVHAVVLNAAPPSELGAKNTIVTQVNGTDQPGALARTLFRSLTMTRPGAPRQ